MDGDTDIEQALERAERAAAAAKAAQREITDGLGDLKRDLDRARERQARPVPDDAHQP